MRAAHGGSVASLPGAPHISHSDSCISSPSPREGRERRLEWLQRQRTTDKEPQMITAFFIFVTTAFFAAIVANVAETVTSTRAFA
jgi:hypothetical protein